MTPDFDMQAAWLRRFTSDAESNLQAFALRLQEAMPDRVTLQESRGFLSRSRQVTGVTVELGDSRYILALAHGRLAASIALTVHGIVLNTRSLPPAEWFAKLNEETGKASEQAQALSRSLTDFMAG